MTHSHAARADSADVADAGPVAALEIARSPLAMMLARAGGNRATQQLARQLMIARDTWWRGVGQGVAPAAPGSVIHDFGDGMYLSDNKAVGQEYAELRAGPKGTPQLFKAEIDAKKLGRVLDLTKDVRWGNYVKGEGYPGGRTIESLIKGANENYKRFFDSFLEKFGLKLSNYDAVIGPEYVRGGNELCIRNQAIAAEVRASLGTVKIEPKGGGGSGAPPAAGGGKAAVPEGTKPPTGAGAKPAVPEGTKPPATKPGPVGGPPARGTFRLAGLLRAVRSIGIQMIFFYILQRFAEERERERVDAMWAVGRRAGGQQAGVRQHGRLAKLADADPFRTLYADVTVEIIYRGNKYHGGVHDQHVSAWRCVDAGVGTSSHDTKEEILKDEDGFGIASTVPFTRTSQLSYVAEISFEGTQADRVTRSAYVYAEQGTGAETAATGKGWTPDQKAQFAKAYVDITAGWTERQAQHDAAKAYFARLLRLSDLGKKYSEGTVGAALASARRACRRATTPRARTGRRTRHGSTSSRPTSRSRATGPSSRPCTTTAWPTATSSVRPRHRSATSSGGASRRRASRSRGSPPGATSSRAGTCGRGGRPGGRRRAARRRGRPAASAPRAPAASRSRPPPGRARRPARRSGRTAAAPGTRSGSRPIRRAGSPSRARRARARRPRRAATPAAQHAALTS